MLQPNETREKLHRQRKKIVKFIEFKKKALPSCSSSRIGSAIAIVLQEVAKFESTWTTSCKLSNHTLTHAHTLYTQQNSHFQWQWQQKTSKIYSETLFTSSASFSFFLFISILLLLRLVRYVFLRKVWAAHRHFGCEIKHIAKESKLWKAKPEGRKNKNTNENHNAKKYLIKTSRNNLFMLAALIY